jgi:uncharacterized repeat protein (TIGR03803 family)
LAKPYYSLAGIFALAVSVGQAQVVTTLISFDLTNGEPNSLVQGSDGNFYGTSGIRNDLFFKLTPQGVLTPLYRFTLASGVAPVGGLIQLADGNFYGTTTAGGAKIGGTIFKLTPAGSLTVLYSFGTNSTDGLRAQGLMQASDGNLYGTTLSGGANGLGVIFRISPAGQFTTLYAFGTQATDGGVPYGRLIQGSDGNIYGTTSGSGRQGSAPCSKSALPACSRLFTHSSILPRTARNPRPDWFRVRTATFTEQRLSAARIPGGASSG